MTRLRLGVSIGALAIGFVCSAAFYPGDQIARPDLTRVWTLEMHTAGDATDTVTLHGQLVLVSFGLDSATWSLNVSKPDYVGAFAFAAPRAAYLPRAVSEFPAVAAQWTAGDSLVLSLGPQNVDHGWLRLTGVARAGAICGSWQLTGYAVAHAGSYCLRRRSAG